MTMTLFVLLGPTAVGKTELSLKIARHLGCPIINCDSRQLYKGMQIGTATPTAQEMASVTHYFVSQLELHEYYSAARYETDVLALMETLAPTYPNVLLSGGSMMYIDAVCQGIDDIPTVDPDIRNKMRKRLGEEGLEPLLAELKERDPQYYDIVDRKNHKRVVHALEIIYTSGQPYTSFRSRIQKERPFRIVKIGLKRERQELFDRINRRVDQMMDNGLLDEARALLPYRNENALNTVGYKELFRYLDGEWPLDMAVERIKKNTRVYAKKQMTWFQRDPDIHWFHPGDETGIMAFIDTFSTPAS
ncbi:MAG: tRNA (adenosine(37)-N6)-dimethylallyltransferase MiaA [Bacteroidaceae bacterium]|nr:tRNA (adenosine(37)-N6)-dimethylallyltransferase MiaA [Bacteroidaceae bacterium]